MVGGWGGEARRGAGGELVVGQEGVFAAEEAGFGGGPGDARVGEEREVVADVVVGGGDAAVVAEEVGVDWREEGGGGGHGWLGGLVVWGYMF